MSKKITIELSYDIYDKLVELFEKYKSHSKTEITLQDFSNIFISNYIDTEHKLTKMGQDFFEKFNMDNNSMSGMFETFMEMMNPNKKQDHRHSKPEEKQESKKDYKDNKSEEEYES